VVSRGATFLLVVPVVVLGGLTVRNLTWDPPPVPPVPAQRNGLECFRSGGATDYCRCLDRLESARSAAGLPAPELPPLDHPTIKHALRYPELYPVINADTLRCLGPQGPAPGDRADATVGRAARA
jgi:hypothetical protein